MGERIVLMRWGFILFFAAHIFACFFFFISKVCCLAGLQLHRDSPTSAPELARTSAPGLAHICAGTRPHLRRDLQLLEDDEDLGDASETTWVSYYRVNATTPQEVRHALQYAPYNTMI